MQQKQSGLWRAGLLASVLAVASFVWIGHAQQEPSTFTGTSLRLDTDGVVVGLRSFEAGSRTHWHIHSAQLLFVKEGRLRYQVEGQPVAEVGLQEAAHLPRGVRHWHGATPDEALIHVSVTLPNDAGERLTIEWMEPVSDAVYGGAADR